MAALATGGQALQQEAQERQRAEAAKTQMVARALEFDQVLLQLRGQTEEELDAFLPLATEVSARSLNVERISVWLFDVTGQELQCRDLYQRGPQTHSCGPCLQVVRYPHYFEALASHVLVAADDALHDPATSEFVVDYLTPLGIGAMLDVPLLSAGKLVGVLCCEHVGPARQWTVQEQKFATAVGAHVMLAIEAAQRHQTLKTLGQRQEMLAAIRTLHEQFLLEPEGAIQRAFESLLALLLHTTQSEFGFAGEVLYTADGQPYLKVQALSNIAWNDDSRRLYDEQASQGLEFHNLKTLFGAVLSSGEAVIANSPATDPRRGGLPPGHPPLRAFLGIPIRHGTELLGMVGLANRPGGYAESTIAELEPLLATAGSLILADRSEQQRLAAEAELHRLNDTLELRVRERTAQLGAANEELLRNANQLRLFRTLLDQSTDGIYIVDPATSRFLDVNEAACHDLGYTREELLQRSVADIQTNFRDLAAWQAHLQELAAQGKTLFEFEGLRKDGSRFPVEVSAKSVSVADQDYVIAVVRDINERKRSEQALQHALRAQRALSACNAILIHATEEPQLLTDMCRTVVEQGGYRMVWIGYAEHDAGKRVRPMASAGYEAGYLDSLQISWDDSEHGQGPTGRAVRSGQPTFARDIAQDSAYGPWREQALQRGYTASIALPLKESNGAVFGVLNIYATEALAFDDAELQLLQELTEDMAFGVLTLRTRHERDHYQQELLKSISQLKDALIGAIRAIAMTVEKRDPYTAGHQSQVAELAAAIAQQMGMEAERIEGLRLGAMIHDIGKIYVPAEILNRPGRLSENEFGMIKTHPEVGYDIIKGVKFPWPVADMVLQHHERLDGSGYPKGLKGEEIILEARILAVADVVEAITAHRPYRPAFSIDKALAEIEAGRGQSYDADAVDACLRLFREQGYSLSTGSNAIPVASSP